ncbi:Ppx/GppA phosphatase family protein [Propionispora hippei]|uniref:Exopolyphosphatase / guanosine-5'-triphosphate,3'-diphosphate pyrophosphatase n=1 Tax=Propionispora hippei DSM 15287 TaxID=1123003 RepID=A0A1M6IG66_9FIRM|nr:HD domain-containing protein [Propionispora hippei]SHJ33420.1 exopolyphosphatase / guanosine-5'-triphosphate,3'-diphosphate pyrophosphatase [Propionispora hippei DSM 15287]
MSGKAPDLFAAVHIGSEQISLQIVEYKSLQDIKVIERANYQMVLGEETFKTGQISFSAVSELCELLKGYRRLLAEYGVTEYRLVATTAIREADNQQYIIDQIRVKTGFRVEVAGMTQEIFYKYVALYRRMQEAQLANRTDAVLFVDISSGGLGITLYKQGALIYQQNLHIGILRIKESFEKHQRESLHFHKALEEFIYSVIAPVQEELGRHQIKYLVLSGLETNLLLSILGREPQEAVSYISLHDFYQLYKQVVNLNLSQIIDIFNLAENKADMVLPTIILYRQIMALTDVEQIVIANDQFIDGITTLYIAENTKDAWLQDIEAQLVSLARSFARRYRYNEAHAEKVEEIALIIYDRIVKLHGMGKRERLLLKVAAILHDIGKFINLRRHYLYSYRLILSSDILGFSEEEKIIMASVAYYHSKGTPSDFESGFNSLTKEQKVTVAKLAAILRLANSLDCTHRQKIVKCTASFNEEMLFVAVEAREDISLEEWTFEDKARFFENVFGIRAILKRQAG